MIHKTGTVNGELVIDSPFRRLPPDATDVLYSISSYQVWRPGVYDSERAARYAFRFDDETLQALQDSVNPGGVITFEMLQRARKEVSRNDN